MFQDHYSPGGSPAAILVSISKKSRHFGDGCVLNDVRQLAVLAYLYKLEDLEVWAIQRVVYSIRKGC